MRDTLLLVGTAIVAGGLVGYAAFIFGHNAITAAFVALVTFGAVAFIVRPKT